MERRPSGLELPVSEPPERGISRAKAHLLAEGSHWLATGEVFHDTSEPVLARMDDVVPAAEYFDWLVTANDELDRRRPMDYVDADQLEPLEQLLDRMEARTDSVSGSGGGPS